MAQAQRKERVAELFRVAYPENPDDMFATAAVVELVRMGNISAGKAAEVLEMNRDEFEAILAEHGIPSLDVTMEEVRRESEWFRTHRG